MKQHIRVIDASKAVVFLLKIGLVATFALFATVNLYADEIDETGTHVSMINQPSEIAKANRELRALEEEYINATVQALNKIPSGPDFSNDDIYVDYLVRVVEGKTQLTQPNFADDEIYVNHLVKILMK